MNVSARQHLLHSRVNDKHGLRAPPGKTYRDLYPTSRMWFTRQKWVATAMEEFLVQSVVWRSTITCPNRDLPPNRLDMGPSP